MRRFATILILFVIFGTGYYFIVSKDYVYVTFKILNEETNKPIANINYTIREYKGYFFAKADRVILTEGSSNSDGFFSFRFAKNTYYDLEIFKCDQPMKIIGIEAKDFKDNQVIEITCDKDYREYKKRFNLN